MENSPPEGVGLPQKREEANWRTMSCTEICAENPSIFSLLKQNETEIAQLRQENEALKAQVSGLVGALEIIKHAGYPKYPNVATPYELQKIAIEALSTLSSTFLEIQKAKENVIEAAKKSVDWHMRHSQYHVTDSNLQEALRTLQQAQEKK